MKYTHYQNHSKKYFLGGLCALGLVGGIAVAGTTHALTYQDTADVSFTIQPSVKITLSGDLIIDDLSPNQGKDSNIITVTAESNSPAGYTVGATVGNSTDFPTTSLKHKTDTSATADSFTSLGITDSVSALAGITPGMWGYSFSLDNGTSWINATKTGDVNNTGYSGLPLYTTDSPAELVSSSTNATSTFQFKIAASAKPTQASGEYNNVINFVATANPVPEPFVPQPVVTNPGYISYNTNAPTTEVTDTMSDQSIADTDTSAELWASNFQRPGYGFAGWNTAPDYSGTSYGPNETITFTAGQYSGSNPGLSLYAIWIPSAGDLQSWTGCSSLTKANEVANPSNILTQSLTALTDTRDNNTYAVAKLADGNCWMIENLRLADQTTSGAPITINSSNTNSPISTFTQLGTSQDPTSTAWCTTNGSACDDQSMLFSGNTTNPVANMSSGNANIYSYGSYYNWYSATAGNGTYSAGSGVVANGDICPSGWHLPYGGDSTGTKGGNTSGGFYFLGDKLGATTSSAASSNIWRSYPQNFVYSGGVNGSSVKVRSSYGGYWSSTARNSNNTYHLYFSSSGVYPGTVYDYKYLGSMARCMVAGS